MSTNVNESIARASALIERAMAFEHASDLERALDQYQKGVAQFEVICRNRANAHITPTVNRYVETYRTRILLLTNKLAQSSASSPPPEEETTAATTTTTTTTTGTVYDKKQLKVVPRVTFDDIVGLDETKRLLRDAIVLPRELGHMLTGMREPAQTILLFGPPGNGKTELARALANFSGEGRAFIAISSAEIIDKYVGQSEKNIKELMESVKARKPCTLFIDEIDSLCAKRAETSSSSGGGGGAGSRSATSTSSVNGGGNTLKVVNEFLIQLDGLCEQDMRGVLVLGATNVPWTFDPGMMRRFPYRVYVPLPDVTARHELFRRFCDKNAHTLCQEDFFELAERSDHYSASDIRRVVENAAMRPIARLRQATRFHFLDELNRLAPCYQAGCRATNCVPLRYAEIEEKQQIVEPETLREDLFVSLEQMKPSYDADLVARLEEWNRLYGRKEMLL